MASVARALPGRRSHKRLQLRGLITVRLRQAEYEPTEATYGKSLEGYTDLGN